MPSKPPPFRPVDPLDGPVHVSDARIRAVAAREAPESEIALVRRLAGVDPSVSSRLHAAETLEAALRFDGLLPLPLGLVNRILDRVRHDGALGEAGANARIGEGVRVRALRSRSRREWLAIAAGAVLALGAGIGGLWTVAGSGDLRTLVGAAADPASAPDVSPVASLASLAGEAHASTRAAVASLTSVPDRVPGSPGALGLGAVALLGAAIVGVRRSGRPRAGLDGAGDLDASRDRGGAAGPGLGDASGPDRSGS